MPQEIDENLGGLISLLYEEEGLGKLKGKIGPQYKVYKDSLGILTAGVGYQLSKEEKTMYKEGDVVPVDVVKSWLIKDAKIVVIDVVIKLQDIRPDLLDNEEW